MNAQISSLVYMAKRSGSVSPTAHARGVPRVRTTAEPVDRALLERYSSAWQSGDLPAVVALLHAEATFSMPPVPAWFSGRTAIARFFDNRFCAALQNPQFHGRLIEANAQPAIAFTARSKTGSRSCSRFTSLEHAQDALPKWITS